MDPVIETQRLRLTRITDTDINSEHMQWFHELVSDPGVTSWSLQGTSSSREESRSRFISNVNSLDTMRYVIHIKAVESSDISPIPTSELVLAGYVGLRSMPTLPELPPLPPPSDYYDFDTANAPLTVRMIGYALKESARGHGYMTDAADGLIKAYKAHRLRDHPGEMNYIEAGVGRDNIASTNVVRKLGFQRVGFKALKEGAFLAGKWREAGYDIHGLYV